jgi:hypothetical protein
LLARTLQRPERHPAAFGAASHRQTHPPPAQYHWNDIRQFQRPAFPVSAEPGEHSVITGAAKKVAVEQPSPPAEHGLFDYSRLRFVEIVPQQLFKAFLARHG